MSKITDVIVHTIRKGKSVFSKYTGPEKLNIISMGEIDPKLIFQEDIVKTKKTSRKEITMAEETINSQYSAIEEMINKFGPDKVEEILRLKKENKISKGDWILTKFKPNEFREVKSIDLSDDNNIRFEVTGINDTEKVWALEKDIIDKYKVERELNKLDLLFLYKGRKPNTWKLGDVAIVTSKDSENEDRFDFYCTQTLFINSDIDLEIIEKMKENKLCIPLVFREGRLDYLYLQGFDDIQEEEPKYDLESEDNAISPIMEYAMGIDDDDD
ncbi:hypothetical protein [Heyndrickxia ginsengihumi]|uniref:hypothetical protein n=1 Tax=Heyndrickxia ginsengihumi TaxID=363870 RepID=UPI000471FB9B|nr:hypothetical protein [Heyndrickxia ginsengihumi]